MVQLPQSPKLWHLYALSTSKTVCSRTVVLVSTFFEPLDLEHDYASDRDDGCAPYSAPSPCGYVSDGAAPTSAPSVAGNPYVTV